MRIGIVMPLAEQRGGGEQTLIDLIQHGRNADIDWYVIFLEDGPMVDRIKTFGVAVAVFPSGRLREPHRFIQTITAIATFATQNQLDLLLGWMWKAHLYSGLASIRVGLPSVWYQQELPDDKNLLKRIVNFIPARGVITMTQAGKKAQENIYPHRHTCQVYPGVNIARFNPKILPTEAEARLAVDLPLDIPLIGIVGRLQRWKGIHTLIEAMPKILAQFPDAQCAIVGGKHDLEPDYLDFIKHKISELNLEDRTILAGFQHNVPLWMQAMDVIVHASDNEPFGLVVVEAMALGKPVVAGAAGGPTEIITPAVNGLLAPYGDAGALADAILRYLDDRKFARCMGAAAHIRGQEFTTQSYARNFMAAIHELLPEVGSKSTSQVV
jgi:glycosyltransferase involved in cell wall biosynthesis